MRRDRCSYTAAYSIRKRTRAANSSEKLVKDHVSGQLKVAPEQVQDFYPTPGTASTVMFYTGLDPFTMKPIFVATDPGEKRMQRALLQFNRPRRALIKCGRADLIGFGPDCLVPPEKGDKKPRHVKNRRSGR